MLIAVKEIHVLIPYIGHSFVLNRLISELKTLAGHGKLHTVSQRHNSSGIVDSGINLSGRVALRHLSTAIRRHRHLGGWEPADPSELRREDRWPQ